MTTVLYQITARQMLDAYRAKELSPVEVTRAVLMRIDSWERQLNAMYIIDAEGALAHALASESRWHEGRPLSPLDGVPITIKDLIATRGVPVPVGTAAADFTPAAVDQPPAARVREAGCVILGKTTMPDYGMLASGVSSLHGITRNPWNTQLNTSGSSSGAGAAIAAGYGPLALGTDIGGSVRLPAAYNGIFALKPSLGRIPIYPPYLGRVTGPMTRTVSDAATLMNVLTKPDSRDYMALPFESRDWAGALDGQVGGMKLGLLIEIGVGIMPQPAVRRAIETAAKTFEDAGATVEPVAPFVTAEMLDGLDLFFQSRLLAEIDRLPQERQAKVMPFILEWCRRAEGRSAVDALRAFGQIIDA
jgi:aspartyl-tRNA(Asn)/glutamyl-tRNA(Gln) amidotransferase subunit A